MLSVNRLKKPTVSSFILDCEIVAYDRSTQKIRSFQVILLLFFLGVNTSFSDSVETFLYWQMIKIKFFCLLCLCCLTYLDEASFLFLIFCVRS